MNDIDIMTHFIKLAYKSAYVDAAHGNGGMPRESFVSEVDRKADVFFELHKEFREKEKRLAS